MTVSVPGEIRDSAYDILTGYEDAIEENDFSHPTVEAIKNRLPDALDAYFEDSPVTADHAKFVGRLNHIPWVSLSHDYIEEAPQDGFYVVYLFDYQADQLILSLGHGTKRPRDAFGKSQARELLTSRAEELRTQISPPGFKKEAPELEGTTSRSDLWGPATTCYKRYTPTHFPDSEEFVRDLSELVEEYIRLVDEGVFETIKEAHPDPSSREPEPDTTADELEAATTDQELYQVILTADRSNKIWANYEQTIQQDVPGEAVQAYFESDAGARTRVWGAPDFHNLQSGDLVIFSDRDSTALRLIGRVAERKDLSTDVATEFADAVGWEYEGSSSYTNVALFDRLWKPDISVSEFLEVLDYSDFPTVSSFQRINTDRPGSTFHDRFGTVNGFQNEATGELIFPNGSDPHETTHPLVDHATSEEPTVWTFTTGYSDILTDIRRSAVHVSEKKRGKWAEIEDGDIVLLRCMGGEEKIEDFEVDGGAGIVGAGIVSSHSKKTDRWWWNEFDSLEYPLLLEFEELYVPSDLASIDLTRPTFQQSISALESEIEALLTENIPYSDFEELVGTHTQGGVRTQGEFQKHRFDDGPTAFVHAIVNGFDSLYSLNENATRVGETQYPDDQPRRDRLAGMLPQEAKPDRAEELKTQLEKQGQVVNYGPPGTGKTYTARRFARWWLTEGENRVPETRFRTVTFHPSFAYEDFMEGLTAEANDDGQVVYKYKNGVFKQMCKEARKSYEESIGVDDQPDQYVLMIDELNRGNLPKIFGEAVTQLEMDKRLDGPESTPAYWAHSGEEIAVPPNLFIIGTMNTADQSITLVDAAIRRRFSFHSFQPDFDVLMDNYDFDDKSSEFEELLDLSRRVLEGINARIRDANELGRGKQVGHSYLLNHEDVDDIVNAWQFEILPLLEEYYFGDLQGLVENILGIDESEQDQFPLFDMNLLEISDLNQDSLIAGLEMLPQIEETESEVVD